MRFIQNPMRVVAAATLSAALLFVSHPPGGLAQTADAPTPGAWWAEHAAIDDATVCAVGSAWNQAIDAEVRAEHDLTTDGLPEMLQGSELVREQQFVSSLREDGHGLASDGIRGWKIIGASGDEAVVYATSTRLVGNVEPGGTQLTGAAWVEDTQTAYRLARTANGWRVSDQHVFEQHQHPADLDAFAALTPRYRQLVMDALGAFSTGDSDNLDLLLVEPALDFYRQRVQAAANAGKLQRVTVDGDFAVIDVSNDTAVAAFVGTASVADIDPTTGAVGPTTQQPYAVAHRLQRQSGDWKIAYEFQDSTQTDPDGTVHLAGCP
jgi:hypothetical protein